MPACAQCSQTALLRCSRCQSAYYCNNTCQRTHWAQHKAACQQLQPQQQQHTIIEIPTSASFGLHDDTTNQAIEASILAVMDNTAFSSDPPHLSKLNSAYMLLFNTLNDSADTANKSRALAFFRRPGNYALFLSFGVYLFTFFWSLKERRDEMGDLIRARCLGIFKQNLMYLCAKDVATVLIDEARAADGHVQNVLLAMMDLKGKADDIEALVWQAVAVMELHGAADVAKSVTDSVAKSNAKLVEAYVKNALPYAAEFLRANGY